MPPPLSLSGATGTPMGNPIPFDQAYEWAGVNMRQVDATKVFSTTDDVFEVVGVGTPAEALSVDGVDLSTSAASGDVTYLTPKSASIWGTAGFVKTTTGPYIRVRFKTPAALANMKVAAGFCTVVNQNIDHANQTDGAWIQYPGTGTGYTTEWVGKTINNAGTTQHATAGPTGAVSSEVILTVLVDDTRYPHFYVNDRYLGRGEQLDNATNIKPFLAVQTGTTAAKTISYRGITLQNRYPA